MVCSIIFLDIDGVLNSDDWFVSKECGENTNNTGFPASHFDPKAVARLNRITDETCAKIVVSSSWRTDENIKELLQKFGITGEIIGYTPVSDRQLPSGLWTRDIRGKEIQEWIDENKPTRYCIIDDDTDMLPEQGAHFVNTDFMRGITEKDMQRAISILTP